MILISSKMNWRVYIREGPQANPNGEIFAGDEGKIDQYVILSAFVARSFHSKSSRSVDKMLPDKQVELQQKAAQSRTPRKTRIA